MIAAPWYLLSLGIVVILVGSFLSTLLPPTKPTAIDPKMSDEQIVQNLETRETISWPSIVVLGGFVLIGISILWRLLRWIL